MCVGKVNQHHTQPKTLSHGKCAFPTSNSVLHATSIIWTFSCPEQIPIFPLLCSGIGCFCNGKVGWNNFFPFLTQNQLH